MITLIIIYTSFNLISFGFALAYQDNLPPMKRYLVLATNLFFGLPISLLVVMYAVINEIDGYLQIRFFVSYMFTNKHYNVEIEKLEMINQSTKYRNKIYKYAVRLLNKRNNYTYSEPQED